MNYNRKICSFTGYRTQKLNEILKESENGIEKIRELIGNEIERMLSEDFEIFKSGMAVGSDTIFAETVLKYKERYPRVRLVAVIPCLEQERLWNESDKIKYRSILAKADETEIVNRRPYFDGCMQIRNKTLAESCDELLAVYDGRHGGTMHTVNYAVKLKRKVTVIDPVKLVKITLLG